jgi:hypothetical protein
VSGLILPFLFIYTFTEKGLKNYDPGQSSFSGFGFGAVFCLLISPMKVVTEGYSSNLCISNIAIFHPDSTGLTSRGCEVRAIGQASQPPGSLLAGVLLFCFEKLSPFQVGYFGHAAIVLQMAREKLPVSSKSPKDERRVKGSSFRRTAGRNPLSIPTGSRERSSEVYQCSQILADTVVLIHFSGYLPFLGALWNKNKGQGFFISLSFFAYHSSVQLVLPLTILVW